MKKLVIVLVMLIVLCGCSANTSTVEKGNDKIEDVTEPDLNEEGILADDSDEQPTRIRVPAHDGKLASRINNAKLNNTTVKEASNEEVLARSAEITKGNADFNDLMDFVYDALYNDVPVSANYPAVKYIVGNARYRF